MSICIYDIYNLSMTMIYAYKFNSKYIIVITIVIIMNL